MNADNKMMNLHRQQINDEERLKPTNFFISFITVRVRSDGLGGATGKDLQNGLRLPKIASINDDDDDDDA